MEPTLSKEKIMIFLGIFFIMLGCSLLCIQLRDYKRNALDAEEQMTSAQMALFHVGDDHRIQKQFKNVVKTVIAKNGNHRVLYVYNDKEELLHSVVIWR